MGTLNMDGRTVKGISEDDLTDVGSTPLCQKKAAVQPPEDGESVVVVSKVAPPVVHLSDVCSCCGSSPCVY